MNIGHSRLSLCVGDHDDVVGDVVLIDPLIDEVGGMVGGGVVDDDYLVVLVVEVDDGLQVVLVAEFVGVVEGGYHDTEREFLKVEIVLFGEAIGFFIAPVPDLVFNVDVGVGVVEVA